MADLTVTAANVRVVFAERAETRDGISAAAIAAGDLVYQNTSGNLDLADADAIASGKPFGVALESVAAGTALTVLKRGYLAGFDMSAQAYGAQVYVSVTAGKIADAAAAGTPKVAVKVGCVEGLSDPARTKILRIDISDGVNIVAL